MTSAAKLRYDVARKIEGSEECVGPRVATTATACATTAASATLAATYFPGGYALTTARSPAARFPLKAWPQPPGYIRPRARL